MVSEPVGCPSAKLYLAIHILCPSCGIHIAHSSFDISHSSNKQVPEDHAFAYIIGDIWTLNDRVSEYEDFE